MRGLMGILLLNIFSDTFLDEATGREMPKLSNLYVTFLKIDF